MACGLCEEDKREQKNPRLPVFGFSVDQHPPQCCLPFRHSQGTEQIYHRAL